MSWSGLLVVAICVVLETFEQLTYRMASHRRGWGYCSYAAVAIILHVIGLGIWFLALKLAPLSVAMPLMGAAYVTVALASARLFNEQINARRWFGIALVVIGVVLLGGTEI